MRRFSNRPTKGADVASSHVRSHIGWEVVWEGASHGDSSQDTLQEVVIVIFQADSKISPGRHREELRDEMVEECRPRQDQEWRGGVLPPGRNRDNLALHFNGPTWSADITTAWDPWYFL